ncbi:hypothetical protein GGTG_07990 [Gaeumannomyces tritici R3-111a-1]|uniref:Uncharacterized protein n=1 Tax=Gaeumannomyces tritici (strain R3-111a-1) TaxID=644352 RepID=J3P3A2_GAET3|nr:hypothetical protein GGTG_07990 [Gaeumannomyces tritici R3-111a-1]EJT74144.1 hypothetical protein GGTG_07990 [Gaeumannomyces tritici R3-111a-1]
MEWTAAWDPDYGRDHNEAQPLGALMIARGMLAILWLEAGPAVSICVLGALGGTLVGKYDSGRGDRYGVANRLQRKGNRVGEQGEWWSASSGTARAGQREYEYGTSCCRAWWPDSRTAGQPSGQSTEKD